MTPNSHVTRSGGGPETEPAQTRPYLGGNAPDYGASLRAMSLEHFCREFGKFNTIEPWQRELLQWFEAHPNAHLVICPPTRRIRWSRT